MAQNHTKDKCKDSSKLARDMQSFPEKESSIGSVDIEILIFKEENLTTLYV